MNLPTPERDRDPRHPLPSTRVYLFEIRGDRKARQLGLLFQSWTFNLSNRDFTHISSGYSPYSWASTQAKIKGATIAASDSITYLGVSMASLPQVIFSLGTAPEYEP